MNKKNLWVIGAVLLGIIIFGLFAWLGGGMVSMIRNHMGM
jgi:hypothetical protein